LIGVALGARPWRGCIRPSQDVDELLLPVEVVVADVVEQSDFFEELTILVGRSDEAQGLLRPEGQPDLVCDIMVRLGYVRDQRVCRLDP